MDKKYVSREKIEKDILGIISEIVDAKKEKVTLKSELIEDLGVDSLAAAEIMFAIQERFSIEMPQENMIAVKSVDDIVSNLEKALKA